MNGHGHQQYITEGFLMAVREGAVAVPALLLKYYRQIGLSDAQAMLLIHLLTFKEKEQKDFPTLEEIQARMSSSPQEVIRMLQECLKQGVLTIEEEVDPETGIRSERYDFAPLYAQIAACAARDAQEWMPGQREVAASQGDDVLLPLVNEDEAEIFTLFENEFARPLSPMECELISSWLDKDGYSKELIIAALKEAVFAGKVYFRYIDRILLEWSRNRVKTAEQAREYTQKFRGGS
jgi:DNA replication protein